MSLEELRKEIEEVDREIVKLVAERLRIARAIGHEKTASGLPVTDLAREKVVLEKVRALARSYRINEDGIESLYREMMRLAKSVEGTPDL